MTKPEERINYRLRPAKNIERKMIAEALVRLTIIENTNNYKYIGFGSWFFSDFALFHRSLGIKDMLSIEREAQKQPRVEFNRPFRCIDLDFRNSSEVLGSLSWDNKTILWLDYTDKLNNSILADIKFFCSGALPGSVIILTVNAEPDKFAEPRIDRLKKRIDETKIPGGTKPADLGGWGTADLYWRIIRNEISSVLNDRNGGRVRGQKLLFKQLFHFRYADDARMMTYGGLLYDEEMADNIVSCKFEKLRFVRMGEKHFKIRVPNLTIKEVHHLDEQLPITDPNQIEGLELSEEDIRAYVKIYRYFPVFTESEL